MTLKLRPIRPPRCQTMAPGYGRCVRRKGHPGDCVLPLPKEAHADNVLDVGGVLYAMAARRLAIAKHRPAPKPEDDETA